MPSSSYSSALPSVGPPLSSWSTTSIRRRSGVRDKRHQKLGLWSAVALQQHFTTTGGQRGRPLPSPARPPVEEEDDDMHQRTAAAPGSSYDVDGDVSDGVLDGEGTRAAVDDLRTHLGPAGSLPGHPHKPTLAQRMGLVPAPPPSPTAEDWQVVVHRAMLREQQQQQLHSRHTHHGTAVSEHRDASSTVCAICQMSFLTTSDEGQVILSCSHVFHTQCFRAFERCVRAQQRADGAVIAEVTAQLACPVCRTQHYYKRVFYEGKAMTQRAAIVKVQSAIRGFLARRRYVQQRLRSNAAFRTTYVQERLARLSAAWSAFCAQQARHRETTLAGLRAQHQAATAAYLTEDEWTAIWQAAMGKATDTCNAAAAPSGMTEREAAVIACPICLERIHETYFTQQRQQRDVANTATRLAGYNAVAELRVAYEQRQTAAQQTRDAGNVRKPSGAAGDKKTVQRVRSKQLCPTRAPSKSAVSRVRPRIQPKLVPKEPADATAADSTSQGVQLPSLPPPACTTCPVALFGRPRDGVLLSCGHCFHAACLGCYERFNEHRMTESADSSDGALSTVVVADRCPICRAGYAKHPL